MENTPQSQPDILNEARSYENVDSWLGQIPDERLQQIINILDQVDNQDIKDPDALANVIGVAMYFTGTEPMSIPEITRAFQVLAVQASIEAHVRNGVMEKHSSYTMKPTTDNANFSITDKGREIYGNGDKA